MELRKGYKQTDLGVIPSDWKISELGEIGEVKMCKRIFNHETKSDGEIPFFKIGTFGKEPDAFITQELYKNYRERFSFPKKGTILISAAGTIGRTIIYDGLPSYFQDSNIVWIENEEKIIPNIFLYHLFQTVKYNTEGGTIQRLYNSIIKSTKFICPSKAEQTAIATALSDADALISSLEKLIEKKRNIKQGAMQQLLKPKNGTVIKSLGEVIIKKQKTSHQSSFGLQSGNFPFFTNSSNDKIEKYFNDYDFDDEVIIANTGGVSHFKYFNGKFASMSDCFVFTSKEKVKFLFYFLKSIEGFINDNYFTGSGIKHLDKKYFSEIKLSLPNIDEQNEIVEILSDMDNEITSLEKKLSKSKMLKQGMMQELLTGKIRLV